LTLSSPSFAYYDLRSVLSLLNVSDAAILALSRSLLEWHQSALFCGRCGSRTVSIQGGGKRECTAPKATYKKTTDSNSQNQPVVNYCGRSLYPRTDCVTIALIISEDRTRVLLGRKKEFPKGVYTCLAGFLEGGETIEEGVIREVYEESGIRVGSVCYFASQPWPFLGGQLMIGCYGQSISQQHENSIQLLDQELEDAQFFTYTQIQNMIKYSRESLDSWNMPTLTSTHELRIPPPFAIAHQLIANWYQNRELIEKQLDARLPGQTSTVDSEGMQLAHL